MSENIVNIEKVKRKDVLDFYFSLEELIEKYNDKLTPGILVSELEWKKADIIKKNSDVSIYRLIE